MRGERENFGTLYRKRLRGVDSLPLLLLSDHHKSDLLMHPGWSLLCFSLLKYVLSLLKTFILFWSIGDLQCCVSFRCTAVIQLYIYLIFFKFFPHLDCYVILSRERVETHYFRMIYLCPQLEHLSLTKLTHLGKLPLSDD